MKKKLSYKKLVIFAIILLIIIFSIFIFIFKSNKKDTTENVDTNLEEPFVLTSENGSKTNISSKIKEKKIIEDLEFSNISINSNNNVTTISGKVSNNTKNSIKGFYFKLYALNESNDIIAEADGILDSTIDSGKSTSFNLSTSKDFANCYDIKIKKIKDID